MLISREAVVRSRLDDKGNPACLTKRVGSAPFIQMFDLHLFQLLPWVGGSYAIHGINHVQSGANMADHAGVCSNGDLEPGQFVWGDADLDHCLLCLLIRC